MKYSKITALVPGTEHFDESAVNEGVWLSVGHLNNIESALTDNDSVQSTNAELMVQIQELENADTESASTIRTQAARITELEAEVAVLSGKPSGNGSVLISKKDEVAGDQTPTPSYLDANDPINQFADSKMRKKKS